MRTVRALILTLAMLLAAATGSMAQEGGDGPSPGPPGRSPMAFTLRFPIADRGFLDIQAGVRAWSFWHGTGQEATFFTPAPCYFFPLSNRFQFYTGIAAGHSGEEGPDRLARAGVSLPLGMEYLATATISLGIEFTPFFPLPTDDAFAPNTLEPNGGIIIRYSF